MKETVPPCGMSRNATGELSTPIENSDKERLPAANEYRSPPPRTALLLLKEFLDPETSVEDPERRIAPPKNPASFLSKLQARTKVSPLSIYRAPPLHVPQTAAFCWNATP